MFPSPSFSELRLNDYNFRQYFNIKRLLKLTSDDKPCLLGRLTSKRQQTITKKGYGSESQSVVIQSQYDIVDKYSQTYKMYIFVFSILPSSIANDPCLYKKKIIINAFYSTAYI